MIWERGSVGGEQLDTMAGIGGTGEMQWK